VIACAEGQTRRRVGGPGHDRQGALRDQEGDPRCVRAQYAVLGRQIVARAFERAGKAFTEDKLKSALRGLRGRRSRGAGGCRRGEMFSGDVVRAVYPNSWRSANRVSASAREAAGLA